MAADTVRQRTSKFLHHVSLERALSKLGFCSRSQAGNIIIEGRVTVDGIPETNPRRWVNLEQQKICVDGTKIIQGRFRYLMLHKPAGVVTTHADERGRKTVFDLLGDDAKGLKAVGRLDKDSSGLLLLTNDHRFADVLTNPDSHVPKTYRAFVKKPLTTEEIDLLSSGVEINVDGKIYQTQPSAIKQLGRLEYQIVLTEGKNRQVRKMFEAVGNTVIALQRVAMGSLQLGLLKENVWRELTSEEVQQLRSLRQKKYGKGC
ncbi:MAG TPA: pseudouridine synthase [Bacteroidota bacterium]|nr:pseudouridine synthase [Bacteroidota bacterium]